VPRTSPKNNPSRYAIFPPKRRYRFLVPDRLGNETWWRGVGSLEVTDAAHRRMRSPGDWPPRAWFAGDQSVVDTLLGGLGPPLVAEWRRTAVWVCS
jgi:hypothetical protein